MDVVDYNRRAWDGLAARRNEWTVPVGPEVIAAAREGDWSVQLTPVKPVPRGWFPDLVGARVLGLACGGGQQGPVLAAAGARVTVLDASEAQLVRDREVAAREGLTIATVAGDMADLSAFDDGSFELVFHPVANCFAADVRPVWREVSRVLAPGGVLLAGFCNPLLFLFDPWKADEGTLEVRFPLPYSDLESLPAEERERWVARGEPLEFGHTLTDQLGGQLDAGLMLAGLYEDVARSPDDALSRFTPAYIATRAVKPSGR